MDFLQQEVNICYPDGIRLTKFIMSIYPKSVCQSLRKLKDKYTVVLTSYLHTFMNYQKRKKGKKNKHNFIQSGDVTEGIQSLDFSTKWANFSGQI